MRTSPPAGPPGTGPGPADTVGHPRPRTRVALAASAGLVAVVGLHVEIGWGPLVRLDRAVTAGVAASVAEWPALVDGTLVLTESLGPWPLRSLLALVAVVLAVRGHRRAGLWTLAVTAFGSLAGAGLKLLVSRDRPVPTDPLLDEAGFAWPSGHASTAALAAGILVVLATPAVRRWLVPVLVVAAALVGASRVVLGVHWASDVVSGWLLGVAVVLAAVALVPPSGRPISDGRDQRVPRPPAGAPAAGHVRWADLRGPGAPRR